jgi:hypothetical protein
MAAIASIYKNAITCGLARCGDFGRSGTDKLFRRVVGNLCPCGDSPGHDLRTHIASASKGSILLQTSNDDAKAQVFAFL